MSDFLDPDFCLDRPLKKGEVRTMKMNFTAEAGRLGTSVSTADWSTEDTSVISLGTETLSSNIATCPITASEEGKALVKITATLANGDKIEPDLGIEVIDKRVYR